MNIRIICLMLMVVASSGCSRLHTKTGSMFGLDTDVKITFDVADEINPDEKHTPSPLYIRFYELSADQRFSQADFLDLYQNDEQLLGDDLLARRELSALTPGGSREERFVVSPETRYVALFAEFYQYRNTRYKVIFPVTPHNIVRNSIRVQIQNTKMQIKSGQ